MRQAPAFWNLFQKRPGHGATVTRLIEAMRVKAEAARPITGRGIGYKLFAAGLIPSMATKEMQRVYRLLKEARERDYIPWEWIVDETRSIERVSTWADPSEYARCVARSYRRDFWNQQPVRCEVWSEKGTVRGVLRGQACARWRGRSMLTPTRVLASAVEFSAASVAGVVLYDFPWSAWTPTGLVQDLTWVRSHARSDTLRIGALAIDDKRSSRIVWHID